MNIMTRLLLLSILNPSLLSNATPPQPAEYAAAVVSKTCKLDPVDSINSALQAGYLFKVIKLTEDATCEFNDTKTILIVSASGLNNATCRFEMFSSTGSGNSKAQRIAIKSNHDKSIWYYNAPKDKTTGVVVDLAAPKGKTFQFRLLNVYIEAGNLDCNSTNLMEQLW